MKLALWVIIGVLLVRSAVMRRRYEKRVRQLQEVVERQEVQR